MKINDEITYAEYEILLDLTIRAKYRLRDELNESGVIDQDLMEQAEYRRLKQLITKIASLQAKKADALKQAI